MTTISIPKISRKDFVYWSEEIYLEGMKREEEIKKVNFEKGVWTRFREDLARDYSYTTHADAFHRSWSLLAFVTSVPYERANEQSLAARKLGREHASARGICIRKQDFFCQIPMHLQSTQKFTCATTFLAVCIFVLLRESPWKAFCFLLKHDCSAQTRLSRGAVFIRRKGELANNVPSLHYGSRNKKYWPLLRV